MLRIEATLWAAEADPELVMRLCASASSYSVTGTLNTRWEDFCSQRLAHDAGLKDVEWEHTADDTPASLSLSLTVRAETLPMYAALLHECGSVDDYEVYSDSDGDIAQPNNGNGSLYGA